MSCASSSNSGRTSIGLDKRRPAFELNDFREVDLADPESIDRAVASIGGHVDALFNIAGVSSGIGDPELVVTINFLGLRHFTEALVPMMPAGSSIVSVSSLAACRIPGTLRRCGAAAQHRDDARGHRLVS